MLFCVLEYLVYKTILTHINAYCCFCFFFLNCSEENVWKLCEQVKNKHPNELSKSYAVFVSNERRTVPLWRQKAGRGEDKLVVWVNIIF